MKTRSYNQNEASYTPRMTLIGWDDTDISHRRRGDRGAFVPRGLGKGEGKGDMSPGNSHAEKIFRGFWLTHYCKWFLAYICLQLLVLRPQTPTRVLPLDPTGGLLSPVPRFCPPPKQISGYAPVRIHAFVHLLTYLHSWPGAYLKSAISPKRLKIERKLLIAICLYNVVHGTLSTDFWLPPKCMTLNDLWARFKVIYFLNAANDEIQLVMTPTPCRVAGCIISIRGI